MGPPKVATHGTVPAAVAEAALAEQDEEYGGALHV